MIAGEKVHTPDGRTGTVVMTINGTQCWVRCDQVSNVNRLEVFRTSMLRVIERGQNDRE